MELLFGPNSDISVAIRYNSKLQLKIKLSPLGEHPDINNRDLIGDPYLLKYLVKKSTTLTVADSTDSTDDDVMEVDATNDDVMECD